MPTVVVLALLMAGPALSLQLPRTILPEGYTKAFQSVSATLIHAQAPTSPPKLPAEGAVQTGVYRNMFVEYGLAEAAVQARVDQVGINLMGKKMRWSGLC